MGTTALPKKGIKKERETEGRREEATGMGIRLYWSDLVRKYLENNFRGTNISEM